MLLAALIIIIIILLHVNVAKGNAGSCRVKKRINVLDYPVMLMGRDHGRIWIGSLQGERPQTRGSTA